MLLLAAGLLAQAPAVSDVGRNESESHRRTAEFLELAKQAAASYQFRDGEGGTDWRLQPEPLLHWSNPVVGDVDGCVFLWAAGGRPQAIGAIFKWYTPHRRTVHEFHSLSTGPLQALRESAGVWTCLQPGVTFQKISDAPSPSPKPVQRLSQMRALAEQFSALKTDQGVQRELRLLRQPLYRYPPQSDGLLDGGLFAFVEGTDPDLMLLLETTAGEWTYALAPLYHGRLSVLRGNVETWHSDGIPDRESFGHRGPYAKFRFQESAPAGAQ